MMRKVRFVLSVMAALMVAHSAGARTAPDAPPLFAQPWNSGLLDSEPAFHVQEIDADTFVLRQSIKTTFEAPFLYLLFGATKALLIDTGVAGADLRVEVDRLIAARLAARRQTSISLVVMHSHGHSDHVGGDIGFAGRGDTVIVGHGQSEVAAFFGIKNWPAESATLDLGGRVVDILPTPGHHDSHVMVFDRATRLLFSGDAIYPGRLYFQCAKTAVYRASIERVAAFAAGRNVRWVLGAHIEMTRAPGGLFDPSERARRDEHRLELAPSVIGAIRDAVVKMGDRPRVESYADFVVFPHPPDPRGKQPPDWCL